MIYFALNEMTGLVKIGQSEDVSYRLTHLTSADGSPYFLMHVMDGDFRVEAMIHQKFEHLRVEGEYFVMGESILDFIKAHKSRAIPDRRTVNVRINEATLQKLRLLAAAHKVTVNGLLTKVAQDLVKDVPDPERIKERIYNAVDKMEGGFNVVRNKSLLVRNHAGDVFDEALMRFVPYETFHAEAPSISKDGVTTYDKIGEKE